MADLQVGGRWVARQSNGFDVDFDLQQTGGTLHGSASHRGGSVDGDIPSGEVSRSGFHVVVLWRNGSRGDYSGTIGNDGRLHGLTFDVDNHQSQANWFSDKHFR